MNPNNPEELDDFLDKVNEIHKQVTGLAKNEVSLDEVSGTQTKLEEENRRKEQLKRQKEEEDRLKIKRGTSGKGQGDDYVSFCRHCFVEYSFESPVCYHCGKNTLSKQARHDELKLKLDDFKKKKAAKEERKNKWEKWRKTQAIYWKKTSTNYSKWDYFTSSDEEEEENSEPIVPKNDPNFMALEKDLEERMKKKEADRKVALQMKAEGNDFLAKRDYLKAIESYTLGMERVKDMKELYTNRALAYLKLGNYENCIKDCSNMLEFTEIFEKGYEKSAGICLKALLRRAQAYKEVNKIDDAIQDIEQALKLSPQDKDALRLKQEFAFVKEQQAKAEKFKDSSDNKEAEEKKEAENDQAESTEKKGDVKSNDLGNIDKKTGMGIIDDFIEQENPSKEAIEKMTQLFKKDADYKIYANEKHIAKKLASLSKRNNVDRQVYLLIILYIQENPIYVDQFFKNLGPTNLYKKIKEEAENITKSEDAKRKSEFYQDLEEICEVFLNITENEKGRILLKDQMYLNDFLDTFYPLIINNIREEKEAATSYFGLIANLSVISPKFGKYLETQYFDKMLEPLVEKVFKKQKTSKYNRIKENLYGLIANLLREDSFRVKFLNENATISAFYKCILESLDSFAILNPSNLKWIKSVENILAIFINLVFGVDDELRKKFFIGKLHLIEHVRRFMGLTINKIEYCPVIQRVLQLVSRFDFEPSIIDGHKDIILNSFKEHFGNRAKELDITNHALRMYAKWFNKQNEAALKEYLSAQDMKDLVKNLIIITKEDNQERFVNATLLIGNLAEVYPECSSSFKECIPVFLNICKEKMGVIRKNAAICVAKLSKSPENIQVIRDLHGIEILSNISKFILEK